MYLYGRELEVPKPMIQHPASIRIRLGLTTWFASLGLASAAIVLTLDASPAAAQQQQPPQLCKPGHNYDQPKGLCYDPSTAYKANIPKDEDGGGFLSGIGSSLGLGNMISLCQYGDKHVGTGDQAYCVSRRTGEAYPAGR
jgi:hypothetical protein